MYESEKFYKVSQSISFYYHLPHTITYLLTDLYDERINIFIVKQFDHFCVQAWLPNQNGPLTRQQRNSPILHWNNYSKSIWLLYKSHYTWQVHCNDLLNVSFWQWKKSIFYKTHKINLNRNVIIQTHFSPIEVTFYHTRNSHSPDLDEQAKPLAAYEQMSLS